ncbi:MAG TPA: FecR domain-containing protein [Elusimicrobiales bacterium]|nr:FecR domain-containing protein [Elusimicrobiales bacterium]
MKLGKMLVAGAVLLAAMAAAAPEAFCAPKIAAVAVNITGDVQVKRVGESNFSELKVNDMLYPGDTIKTAAGSRAGLVTKGGAEVRLNENSSFEMSAQGKLMEMLNLSVGQLWTRMLHRMAKVNVRTPSAVCAIRGTEADIEQRSLLTVKVYEGHVDVQNSLGKQALRAGQMTTVAGANSAPEAAKKMSGSETGNWQEGLKLNDYDKFIKLLKDSAESGKELKTSVKMPDGSVKELKGELKKK